MVGPCYLLSKTGSLTEPELIAWLQVGGEFWGCACPAEPLPLSKHCRQSPSLLASTCVPGAEPILTSQLSALLWNFLRSVPLAFQSSISPDPPQSSSLLQELLWQGTCVANRGHLCRVSSLLPPFRGLQVSKSGLQAAWQVLTHLFSPLAHFLKLGCVFPCYWISGVFV